MDNRVCRTHDDGILILTGRGDVDPSRSEKRGAIRIDFNDRQELMGIKIPNGYPFMLTDIDATLERYGQREISKDELWSIWCIQNPTAERDAILADAARKAGPAYPTGCQTRNTEASTAPPTGTR